MKKYNVAILGATGAVGTEFLNLIEERNFPFGQLRLLASKRSAGKEIEFMGKTYVVEEATENSFRDIDIALFAGGCNVGINVNANKIYFNDNLTYLIEMYQTFQENDLDTTILHIENRIKEFELSLTNEDGYKKMRAKYNEEKNPLDLFVLIAFSFNHQIRFNNNHEFNNPFGRERSSFNASMKQNLEKFIIRLKESYVVFSNVCFNNFDFNLEKGK